MLHLYIINKLEKNNVNRSVKIKNNLCLNFIF